MTGRRGPISMPNNVRTLKGNPGKRTTKESVKARPGIPSPPSTLGPLALAEWRRIIPLLVAEGHLSRLDRGVVVMYCEAWEAREKAVAILRDQGLTVYGGDSGVKKNPAWQIWREASASMLAAAKEMLATPIARVRTTKPEAADGYDAGEGILD